MNIRELQKVHLPAPNWIGVFVDPVRAAARGQDLDLDKTVPMLFDLLVLAFSVFDVDVGSMLKKRDIIQRSDPSASVFCLHQLYTQKSVYAINRLKNICF